jgi:hypothetical protein
MTRRLFLAGPSSLLAAGKLSVAASEGKPTMRRMFTKAELARALASAFASNLLPGALRATEDFDDPIYCLPTRGDVETLFRSRTTLHQPWSENVFDCEDFAYSLRADFARYRYRTMPANTTTPFATGIVWGLDLPHAGRGFHVVNIAVTCDAGLLLLDAAPDGGIFPAEGWRGKIKYLII